MSKKFLFLISFVLVLTLANSASAQDANLICWWTNAGPDSNLWSDANNWYTADWNDIDDTWVKSAANSVPAADDVACIGQGADWFPYPNGVSALGPIGNCRLDSNAVCYQLYIGADPCDTNQPNHLEMTGGSLTIKPYGYDWDGLMIAWNTGSTGSMTIHDGNVSISYIFDPPDSTAGGMLNVGGYTNSGTTGTLTMYGGTVTCYHFDCPDAWMGEVENVEAHFNLYGGTLYTTGDEEWMEFWLGMEGLSPNSLMDITEGKVIITSSEINDDGPEQELIAIRGWIAEGKIIAYGGDPNYRVEIYADYDITNPGKTTLQAIATTPCQAWNPQPRPGATVDYRPTLSWTPGDGADSHVVYLSSDRAAVINGTAPNTPTSANSIGAGILEFSTAYCWRVDEVNEPYTCSGLVWDFKTADHLDVDDMDSYADHAAIKAVWKDFWTGTVAKNGAEVFVETVEEWVRNGQSMKFYYRNRLMDKGKPVGSVAEASTSDLEIGSDWVSGAPKALVLYFYGDSDNLLEPDLAYTIANDRMWVAVEDGVGNDGIVRYHDMNDVQVQEWQDWNIDLQDPCLSSVDMNNVAKVYIGFGGVKGGAVSKVGAGYTLFVGDTVWFDDISLYPPRCVAELGPAGDITGDCIASYPDIDIMSRDWLDTDALISPSEPPIDPLAFYQFEEGAGDTIANDGSLGSLANGTIYADGNRPTWVTDDPCVPYARCMEFDGINDYVEIPDFNSIVEGGLLTNTATITAWIKRNGSQGWWTGLVFCTRDVPGEWEPPDGSVSIFGLSLGDEADWEGPPYSSLNEVVYHWDTRPDFAEVGWMFRSGLLVPDGLWTFAAVVVRPTYGTVYMSDGTTLESAVNHDIHLKTAFTEPFQIGRDPRGQWEEAWWVEGDEWRAFNGRIDDVRIYDYSLSKGQISWLAGVTEKVYDPLISPANLLPKDPCDSADPNLGSGAFDPNNIDIVDFRDYGLMADDWLVGPILWP